MQNDGVKFYQVFKFGDTVGVNRLSLTDVLSANFLGLIVMIALLGVLASIVPIILLLFYCLLVLGANWEEMQLNRIRVNIFAIFGYVYFMIDYHFGFIGWLFFNTMFGADFVDKLCYINTALFILNILLMFFGNNLFVKIEHSLGRLLAFGVILFLSSKVLLPIGKALSPIITTQYVPKPGDGILDEEMVEPDERGIDDYNYQQSDDNEYIGQD